MTSKKPQSLTSRPLDLLYFIYFSSHIIFSLLLDCAIIYPIEYVPTVLIEFNQFQVKLMKDPLMNIYQHQKNSPVYKNFIWFRTFIYVELLLQVPFFFFACYRIWNDKKWSLKSSGLIYCAHVMTTVLPILTSVTFDYPELTSIERSIILSVYGIYFIIPLILLID
ncbi:hypothetical protein K502DRAFT_302698, partial [Neoconidiobolus thromboides FSU 785]